MLLFLSRLLIRCINMKSYEAEEWLGGSKRFGNTDYAATCAGTVT